MATAKTASKASKTTTQSPEALAAEQAAADAAANLTGDLPQFPAQMRLVNDTAQEWVVGGVHVYPSSTSDFECRDADQLKRVQTDCAYILELSDHYRPVAGAEGETAAPVALRVEPIPE